MRSYSLHLFLQLARIHLINANVIETNFLNLRTPDFPEPATTSALPASGYLKDNPACIILGAAFGICASLTSNFTALQPTAQARCLCYSSTSWEPNIFDAAVKTCADYASTAVPIAYTPLANLQGFCNYMGDIDAAPRAYPTSTSAGGFGGIFCSSVNSYINACASSTLGFATLLAKDQAKCLCYSNSTWVPNLFDGAINTCCQYAQTADPSLYGVISALGGFCQSVGNILSTTTSAASSNLTTLATLTAVVSPTLTSGAFSTSNKVSVASKTHATTQATITLAPVATETGNSSGVRRKGPASLMEVIFSSFGIAVVLIFL